MYLRSSNVRYVSTVNASGTRDLEDKSMGSSLRCVQTSRRTVWEHGANTMGTHPWRGLRGQVGTPKFDGSAKLGFSNHGFMARNCPPKKQWLETARMKHDRSLSSSVDWILDQRPICCWMQTYHNFATSGADRSETERAVWHWAGSHRRKRLMTGANLL